MTLLLMTLFISLPSSMKIPAARTSHMTFWSMMPRCVPWTVMPTCCESTMALPAKVHSGHEPTKCQCKQYFPILSRRPQYSTLA